MNKMFVTPPPFTEKAVILLIGSLNTCPISINYNISTTLT